MPGHAYLIIFVESSDTAMEISLHSLRENPASSAISDAAALATILSQSNSIRYHSSRRICLLIFRHLQLNDHGRGIIMPVTVPAEQLFGSIFGFFGFELPGIEPRGYAVTAQIDGISLLQHNGVENNLSDLMSEHTRGGNAVPLPLRLDLARYIADADAFHRARRGIEPCDERDTAPRIANVRVGSPNDILQGELRVAGETRYCRYRGVMRGGSVAQTIHDREENMLALLAEQEAVTARVARIDRPLVNREEHRAIPILTVLICHT